MEYFYTTNYDLDPDRLKRDIKCASCKKVYDGDKRKPRLLRDCHHVICERCVIHNIKDLYDLTCPICHLKDDLPLHEKITVLPVQKDKLRLATTYNNVSFLKGGKIVARDVPIIRQLSSENTEPGTRQQLVEALFPNN